MLVMRKKKTKDKLQTDRDEVSRSLRIPRFLNERIERFLTEGRKDPVKFSDVARRAIEELLDREFPEDRSESQEE